MVKGKDKKHKGMIASFELKVIINIVESPNGYQLEGKIEGEREPMKSGKKEFTEYRKAKDAVNKIFNAGEGSIHKMFTKLTKV